VLELTREYDQIVFGYFDRTDQPVVEVLRSTIPDQPEPLIAYFRYELGNANPDDLSAVWQRLKERKLVDSNLLAAYVRGLVNRQQLDEAVNVRASFLSDAQPRDGSNPNAVFNGGFEESFTETDLDWKITPRGGVQVERVEGDTIAGDYALRILFGGGENVDFRDVTQDFVARPGRYRCSASLRSEALTTDQGVSLRIYDPADRRRLDLASEPISGTADWKPVTIDFSVSGSSRLLRIGVFRRPSRMFDNKISGSVWLDDVQCVVNG
jgi:hypothetical protein